MAEPCSSPLAPQGDNGIGQMRCLVLRAVTLWKVLVCLQNVEGLLMSLNMLVEFGREASFDYTFSEFSGWAREAGFERVDHIQLPVGSSSAAVAHK